MQVARSFRFGGLQASAARRDSRLRSRAISAASMIPRGVHPQKIAIATADITPLATATANRSGASRSNETLFAQSDKSTPIAQRHSLEGSIEPETADGPRPRQAMPENH